MLQLEKAAIYLPQLRAFTLRITAPKRDFRHLTINSNNKIASIFRLVRVEACHQLKISV